MNPLETINQISLQVNFTPDQRHYFDTLKAELLELFAGQDYETIRAANDAATLKKIADKLGQMIDFVKRKKLPDGLWDRQALEGWLERNLKDKSKAREVADKCFGFKRGGQLVLLHPVISYLDDVSLIDFPPISMSRVSLDLANSAIRELPATLKMIAGNAIFCRSTIKSLANLGHVRETLDLNSTPIENMPEQITIGGDLDLRLCPQLKYLGWPHVKGTLFLDQNCAPEVRARAENLVASKLVFKCVYI